MKRIKQSPKKWIISFGLLALILAVYPAARSNAGRMKPLLTAAGERLALLSALSELPDTAADLLEVRFSGAAIPSAPEAADLPAAPDPPSAKPEAVSSSAPEEPPAPPESSAEPPTESSSDEKEKPAPPEIPAAYRGPMLEEDLSGIPSKNYLSLSPAGYLRNYTKLSFEDIEEVLQTPCAVSVGDNTQPQVLIYHTHATEAFERYDSDTYDTRNNWRSTDNNMNMVAVGNALAKSLEENGINVLHDTTQHDYPSYNGAYERSAQTIAGYREQYPTLQVLLDVHRDAIDRDGTLVRPVTTIDGKKAAQLMIIAPCDDGTMDIPNWRENLRFAAAIQSRAEQDFARLMRPVFFCYRKYNLDKTPASLLLEFGSHGNTLEECEYTASLVGKSIAAVLHELQ